MCVILSSAKSAVIGGKRHILSQWRERWEQTISGVAGGDHAGELSSSGRSLKVPQFWIIGVGFKI